MRRLRLLASFPNPPHYIENKQSLLYSHSFLCVTLQNPGSIWELVCAKRHEEGGKCSVAYLLHGTTYFDMIFHRCIV